MGMLIWFAHCSKIKQTPCRICTGDHGTLWACPYRATLILVQARSNPLIGPVRDLTLWHSGHDRSNPVRVPTGPSWGRYLRTRTSDGGSECRASTSIRECQVSTLNNESRVSGMDQFIEPTCATCTGLMHHILSVCLSLDQNSLDNNYCGQLWV